jgi:hypothetical protein
MSEAVTVSDDYAVLTAGGLRFYFGYEFTTSDSDDGDDEGGGEWCFVVHRVKGMKELMRVPQSKLELRCGPDPVEFLLEGIALWLNTKAD